MSPDLKFLYFGSVLLQLRNFKADWYDLSGEMLETDDILQTLLFSF